MAISIGQRYEVARVIGLVNQAGCRDGETVMLLGPERWGSASPDLGVLVRFAEINRVSTLCEIVAMRENLVPDVSLGTHFPNELVEVNNLYMAIFPQQACNYLKESIFLDAPNRLLDIVPGEKPWQEAVRIVETKDVLADDRAVLLLADANEQVGRIFVGDGQMLIGLSRTPQFRRPSR